MPKAVQRQYLANGEEKAVGLPPYAARSAFPVDEYPAAPDSWMHGSASESSYFVPIVPEHGMWLDFNTNYVHTHHIAIVPSIQGINPITGLKSDPIRLEQYKNMCPKHQAEFRQDRYCNDCNFKWPAQNYLNTVSTPHGKLWLDGFRAEDGVVRQW